MRKKNITARAFKLYSSYNPKYFPLRFAETIFSNLSPYFNLWMSSEIVTALYQGRPRRELLLLTAVTLCGNLIVWVIQAVLNRSTEIAEKILKNNEAAAFHRKTLSLDYDKLENPELRRLRRRIVENSWINGYGTSYMQYNIRKLMKSAANLIFSLALLTEMLCLIASTTFHWLSAVFLAAILAAMILNILCLARNTEKDAAMYDEIGRFMLLENQYSDGYQVSGMDNRIYRQQLIIDRIEDKINKDHLKCFSAVSRKEFFMNIPCKVLLRLSELFSYLLICLYCSLGAFPVGSVIKYVGYLGKVSTNVGDMFTAIAGLHSNERFLETYLEFLDIPNDMYQGDLTVEKRSDKKFDIDFRNVSFQYAGSDSYALKNINLQLKVGERLAVVGKNGSGKTTFIKLLCRLYDPTEGEIYMNDFNIRKYDYRQYLDIFSVVFQDYRLLSASLGSNVSSSAEWDTAKAEKLLYQVGFGERYEKLSKKLETSLYKDFDQDGINISGGEAQKIALARALYKDAPFIILDEPTAALDPVAEAEIYSRFDEIVEDKTAIYISHRLSSCRFCDKIAVFDKGEIVQLGTHEELLSDSNGLYHELWYAQAQYYT